MHAQRIAVRRLALPQLLAQCLPRYETRAGPHQLAHQHEAGGMQRQRVSTALQQMALHVQHITAGAQRQATVLGRVGGDGPGTSQQFRWRERFDHVIHRPRLERSQLVIQRPARGEEQHRRAQAAAALELAAQRQSVLAGQVHVQDHEVECLRLQAQARLRRIAGEIDLHAVAVQVIADAGGDVDIVLHQQQPQCGCAQRHRLFPS